MKLSVIMGIYNCASTLQDALDSLYAQTYQNFEIILCDDGSTDNTYRIAYENQQKHPNIILLRNPHNLGLNQTLNNCLVVAKGQYIARMDGDDLCIPSRFEKQVKFLDENLDYAIVSTPIIHFDEKGEYGRGRVTEGEPCKEIFNYCSPFNHAPCMVRKEAYDRVGGYTVDPKFIRVEDYNLWMKMYVAGYKGYNLSEHLYMMRDDRNAAARRNIKARLNGIYAHWIAYKTLHLSFYLFLRYSIRNIIKAFLPIFVYNHFRRKRFKR